MLKMSVFQKVFRKLDGLHYPQEYLCLAKESFQQPLHVFIVDGRTIIKDITHFHLFTGYSPLVLAISWPAEDSTDLPASLEIVLCQRSFQPNETFEKKDAIARLSLKLIKKQPANNITIFYYEGIKGEHRFVAAFHQSVIELNNRLYNKKEGNIFLADNLYCQVQIAYAVARIISLITVKIGDLYNLFPSDLHGAVNDQYYIGSLRHEGKACTQVETAGRIVISQMNCQTYKTVYSLGKNHMQELKSKDNFPFGNESSLVFQLPLPKSALQYRELELMESFIHGIHKLLLFKIVSQRVVQNDPVTLAHVHNCYATWRYNHGIQSNFLLR
jgi:hypothetical protein